MVDYFIVKRGNIHTPSLFDPSRTSLYYYSKGWNLRALGCWVCAAAFGIPGLVGAYHPTWVSAAATHMYRTGWVLCFVVAATFYFCSNLVQQPKVFPAGHESTPKSFEGLAATEGYFEGEDLIECTPGGQVAHGRDPEDQDQQSQGTSVVAINDFFGAEKV